MTFVNWEQECSDKMHIKKAMQDKTVTADMLIHKGQTMLCPDLSILDKLFL
jgi:hypothetical protein